MPAALRAEMKIEPICVDPKRFRDIGPDVHKPIERLDFPAWGKSAWASWTTHFQDGAWDFSTAPPYQRRRKQRRSVSLQWSME